MRFNQALVFPDDFTEELRTVTCQAADGQATAQLAMGDIYAEGRSLPENPAEALHWYLKAADQKLPEAMLRVGRCYARGLGVNRDMAQSVMWYNKAAAAGNTEAQHLLGTMYARGRSVPRDYQKAAAWFLAAAQSGDKRAEMVYGLMLRDGRGVPRNPTKAYIWLLNAAKSRPAGEVDPILTKTLRELELKLAPQEKKRALTVMDAIVSRNAAAETAPAAVQNGAM